MSTHQIFISSYANDFPWLEPNLKSLRKFCQGFLPPVVCVDGGDLFAAQRLVAKCYPETRVVQFDGRRAQGFMRAQLAMMRCDELSPDKADFYYLVGSDCTAWKTVTPDMYHREGKPLMLYNQRSYFENPPAAYPIQWMDSTAQILQQPVEGEYMRRLPIVYPKELFPLMRAHVERVQGMKFDDYIYARNLQNFPVSESNILGAFAWNNRRDLFCWMDCSGNPEHDKYRADNLDTIIQWWSHGGLDKAAEICLMVNGRQTAGRTPREVMKEILGNEF